MQRMKMLLQGFNGLLVPEHLWRSALYQVNVEVENVRVVLKRGLHEVQDR